MTFDCLRRDFEYHSAMFLFKEPFKTPILWGIAALIFIGAAVWVSFLNMSEFPIDQTKPLTAKPSTY